MIEIVDIKSEIRISKTETNSKFKYQTPKRICFGHWNLDDL